MTAIFIVASYYSIGVAGSLALSAFQGLTLNRGTLLYALRWEWCIGPMTWLLLAAVMISPAGLRPRRHTGGAVGVTRQESRG